MSDLISRQDAKDALVKYARFSWDRFHDHCNLAGMLDAIDNVPPAREMNGEKEEGEPIPHWRGQMDGCLPFQEEDVNEQIH